METITNFGDLAVLLPIILIAAIGLLVKAGTRYAMIWLLATGGCAAVIAVLKAILCCGWPSTLTSPSGHSAISTVVYGGLGFLVSAQRSHWQRTIVTSFAILAVGMIAYSRVVVLAHTPAEVVAGVIVGSLFLLGLMRVMNHQGLPPQFKMGTGAILVGAVSAALLLHGQRLVVPHVCLCGGGFSSGIFSGNQDHTFSRVENVSGTLLNFSG